eukprot:TRINITY_DN16801_c3_g1_i1.p1 TRINITY_DN16801_c3_g1~~TRINITY_DN16801_c3_g1_i1.p1  ORF type:complete len:294 (+),score=74.33 TRINITY_DN16801_c3_g1_i1:23-883(+)
MQYSFWGKSLKDGETHELGRDGSDVLTNCCLTKGGEARVMVNGLIMCVLNKNQPHCSFLRKHLIDTPTEVTVKGSTVDVCGYSAAIEFEMDEEDEETTEEEEVVVENSKKQARKPTTQQPPAKKQKKTPQPVEHAKPQTLVLNSHDPRVGEPMPIEPNPEEEIEAISVMINNVSHFVHLASLRAYRGDLENAEFAGFYDPKTNKLTKKEPCFEIDEEALALNANLCGQKRASLLRKDWEQTYGDAASDVTIDSDDDDRFKSVSQFSQKRDEEAGKMYTRERGMDRA